MNISLSTITTFAASVLVGTTAAIAIAGTAAVSQIAPSLREAPVAPAQVVRLEPVTVTVSKAYYDAVRLEGANQLARTDAKKTSRG